MAWLSQDEFTSEVIRESRNPRASPSGHLEAGESVVEGVIREAREETGVLIDPADLVFRHVVHHRNPEGQARVGMFFSTARWQGQPVNLEPHKCAGLVWADPADPARQHGTVHRRGPGRYHARSVLLP